MKATLRAITNTLGLAALGATLVPNVFAGCGNGIAVPGNQQPARFIRAAYEPARLVLVDNSPAGAAVVGLWHVIMTNDAHFGGGLFDDAYVEWHSDGTEIMNSGVHSPANGNFCMGVWAKTGPSAYTLKHIALDYSVTHSTTPDAILIIREEVTVDQGGDHFTGSFTVDLYAPYSSDFPATPGNRIAQVGGGVMAGDRISAN
jgi:hypothetical protein